MLKTLLSKFTHTPCIWIVFLILVLPFASGCTGKGEAREVDSADNARVDQPAEKPTDEEKKADAEEERIPVEVAAIGTGEIEATLRFSANLEAESEVQVFSQASRQITELLVEEGDRVRAGQVLLRLQDEEQRLQVKRIRSQLAKAKRDHERQTNLYEKELVAEQVFNETAYEEEQLMLSLQDAERELSYTEVRAPISGTITQRLINLGDTVTVNQHLFDLVDFNTIVARIFVPEKELPRLQKGQIARVRASAQGSYARRGKVSRIAPIVDPRSGTVKVTVATPADRQFLPGMYVEVELVTETRTEALLVPKRAAIYDQDQIFIFRLNEEGETVERLRLIPRLQDENFIEPAAETGLQAGDQVVIAGQTGLKNGSEVRLVGTTTAETDSDETVTTEPAPGQDA